jgi:hypothetical protein
MEGRSRNGESCAGVAESLRRKFQHDVRRGRGAGIDRAAKAVEVVNSVRVERFASLTTR